MAEITLKQMTDACVEAVDGYKGNVVQLEAAIGALFVGKRLGWKILYLMHDKKTLRHYEKILGGISFREVLPEVGPKASKSISWSMVQGVMSFWKAVKGEIQGVRSPMITKG